MNLHNYVRHYMQAYLSDDRLLVPGGLLEHGPQLLVLYRGRDVTHTQPQWRDEHVQVLQLLSLHLLHLHGQLINQSADLQVN